MILKTNSIVVLVIAFASSAHSQSTQPAPATQPKSHENSIPEDAIPLPRFGMTMTELEALLKEKDVDKLIPPEPGDVDNEFTRKVKAMEAEHKQYIFHQFTVLRGGHIVEGVKPILPGAAHYFVFVNGRLAKITPSPPFSGKSIDFEVNGIAAKKWVQDPVDPDKRLEVVMNAESISAEQFVSSVKQSIEAGITSRRRHMEPLPIPPDLVNAMMKKAEAEFPKRREEFLHRVAVRTKYDPMKIKPGMLRKEVEALFGSPKTETASENAGITCVYGEETVSHPVPLWVAIVFREDKVEKIWSHDFLNETILPPQAKANK
jgi:hypothetical protein